MPQGEIKIDTTPQCVNCGGYVNWHGVAYYCHYCSGYVNVTYIVIK